ncbi:chorismate synthase [Cohnella zeiphila]|nr:chorismate synthase [Cohnella zeiphila]
MHPSAYDDIKMIYRQGHADQTYDKKYEIRDHRGSGRASGRETAARIVVGVVGAGCWNCERDCPRIMPVIEAMTCLDIEDHYKRQAALLGG